MADDLKVRSLSCILAVSKAFSPQTQFETAAENVRSGPPVEGITQEDKLLLYGWYKQATIGDADPSMCSGKFIHPTSLFADDKPGMLKAYSEAGYKYAAWAKNTGSEHVQKCFLSLTGGEGCRYVEGRCHEGLHWQDRGAHACIISNVCVCVVEGFDLPRSSML